MKKAIFAIMLCLTFGLTTQTKAVRRPDHATPLKMLIASGLYYLTFQRAYKACKNIGNAYNATTCTERTKELGYAALNGTAAIAPLVIASWLGIRTLCPDYKY